MHVDSESEDFNPPPETEGASSMYYKYQEEPGSQRGQ